MIATVKAWLGWSSEDAAVPPWTLDEECLYAALAEAGESVELPELEKLRAIGTGGVRSAAQWELLCRSAWGGGAGSLRELVETEGGGGVESVRAALRVCDLSGEQQCELLSHLLHGQQKLNARLLGLIRSLHPHLKPLVKAPSHGSGPCLLKCTCWT